MSHRTTSRFAELTQQPSLDTALVEAALVELLDAVRADEIPVPAQEEMHGFYDRFQRWRNHFLHHFAPFICDLDQVFSVGQRRPHLLDLGCGVATQAHLLGLRGASITGLDNNADRVQAGRAMTTWFATRAATSPANVTLHADDAFAWLAQQPPGCFDGCYTQFALAYMRPPQQMLKLIDRVVRPGGRIVFREFNAGSLYNRVVSRVDWLTAGQYQQVGNQLGWSCERLEFYWLFPRPIINWSPTRRGLGALETRLTALPGVGAALAAAMTLIFEKPR